MNSATIREKKSTKVYASTAFCRLFMMSKLFESKQEHFLQVANGNLEHSFPPMISVKWLRLFGFTVALLSHYEEKRSVARYQTVDFFQESTKNNNGSDVINKIKKQLYGKVLVLSVCHFHAFVAGQLPVRIIK